MSTNIYYAPTVFKCLNGIINIYKPAGIKVAHVKNALLNNICQDLNELKQRESRNFKTPLLKTGGIADPVLRKITNMDLSDHILANGLRYQIDDIRCRIVTGLGKHTSGVLLFGLNRGIRDSEHIQRNRSLRTYHITGHLGTATDTHLPSSRITVRSKFKHVHPERISSLVASMQASHQRKMYELCGVDLQSQTAYDIACQGLVRPANTTQPVIYSIKLIHFQPPEFTLEVQAINESEQYLATLVYEMALEMRTVAYCSSLRCIRQAQFRVEDALLRHYWNLSGVLKNLRSQKLILDTHSYVLKQNQINLRGEE